MVAENTELSTSLFVEKVKKYPVIYNKFSKGYKNKFIRMNIWKALGEKFGLDAAEDIMFPLLSSQSTNPAGV